MQLTEAQLYCSKDTIKKLCDAVFGNGRNPSDFNDMSMPIQGLYDRTINNEKELSELQCLFRLNGNVIGIQQFLDEVVKPTVDCAVASAIEEHVRNLSHGKSSSGDIDGTINELFLHNPEMYIYSLVSSEVRRQISEMVQHGELKITFNNGYY